MTDHQLKSQDNGKVDCISKSKDGKYFAAFNTFPYRFVKISKKQYESYIPFCDEPTQSSDGSEFRGDKHSGDGMPVVNIPDIDWNFPVYIIIACMMYMFQFLFMVQSCLEESWTNYYWGLFFYVAGLGVTFHENIILFIKTKIGAKI